MFVDDDKYYVLGVINGNPRKWDGMTLDGKMMVIVQKNKGKGCYAIVFSDSSMLLPDNYTQITDEAVILPSDDSGERKIVAIPKHPDTVPHL